MELFFATVLMATMAGNLPGNHSQNHISERGLRLLFWEQEDVADPFGRIEFHAEPLRNLGAASGYPHMQYGCQAPRAEGGSFIYGWRVQNWADSSNRVLEVVRCATEDGLTFFDEQVVFSHGQTAWQGFANIVRRPDDGAIFLFSWAEARLYVFGSDDGENFALLTKEAYVGHDAMCVTWYSPFGQFLNYQTVTQPYPKRYPDNIGAYRRVLSFLRSADGVNWESFSPSFLGSQELWLPDSADPADLEFYRCVVFPYLGRYAMLLADYMPPPAEANSRRATSKHGPSYMAEWAISRDGLNWKRTFRDTNAYMFQFWLAIQGPLVRDGVLRFYHPEGRIAGLPSDRIFYATCRANGEFSTPPFSMPAGGLFLNAYAMYRAVERPNGQAYIMAELRDAEGGVIAGYDRTKCLFEDCDGRKLPLVWEGKNGRELAGKQVRVRLFLRDAKIYGITSAAK